MSRHSAGGDSSAPRRSRRRAAQEEPSITEWLDSGTYGPYAADSNRVDAPPQEEPPYPTTPPSYGATAYEASSSDSAPSYGSAEDVSPSYGTVPYETPSQSYDSPSPSYGSASYGTAAYEPPAPSYESSSLPPYGSTSYGTASYGVSSSDGVPSYGSAEDAAPSYGTAPYEPPAPSYGTAPYEPPAPSYGSSSSPYGSASYGTASSGVSSSDSAPSYGSHGVSSGESYRAATYETSSSDSAPAYGSHGMSSDEAPPLSYGTPSYGGSPYGTDTGPAYGSTSYGAESYGSHASPASSEEAYGPTSYNTGSYATRYEDAPPSDDMSRYGAGSAPDRPYDTGSRYGGAGSFLAPPEYERPGGDRYRSISDPARPAPGTYRQGPDLGPPMADYLTRPPVQEPRMPVQEPPVPVQQPRTPTAPIPSAARSRKAPKGPKEPPTRTQGRLRLRVNPITCDGHGICAELLPEVVSLDEWGYPMPVVAEVPAGLESHAQRAAQQCPTLAIILERRQPRP